MKTSILDLSDLLSQKESELAAAERSAAELRREVDAVRQTITLLAQKIGGEENLTPKTATDVSPGRYEASVQAGEATVSDPVKEPTRHGPLVDALLQVLTADGSQSIEEIHNLVNLLLSAPSPREAVAKTLHRLHSKGKIGKVGYGRYCLLSPKGESPAGTGLSGAINA